MLNKLKKKLVITYSIIVFIVVTTIVCSFALFTKQQMDDKYQSEFEAEFNSQYNYLNSISNIDNLRDYKPKDDYLIFITETNNSKIDTYSYLGNNINITNASKTRLYNHFKKLAKKEGIIIEGSATTNGISNTYTVKMNDEKTYICKCYVERKSMGQYIDMYEGPLMMYNLTFRSIVVAKSVEADESKTLVFGNICALIYILSLFLLIAGSYKLVNNALGPVAENDKRQREFIAAASHELKSPLAVIKANNSAIRIDLDANRQFVNVINSECNRMSRLIEDLLILASSESGKWSINKEKIELDTLLIETYEIFEPIYNENAKKMFLEIPEESLPIIDGDKERIKQVLAILLDNAMNYAGDNITVIIRGRQEKNKIVMEIEDNGIGISDDNKLHIFERFYRVDDSRKDKSHFGLGLSVAYELVRLHGGTIDIRDTSGGGSTFIVSL